MNTELTEKEIEMFSTVIPNKEDITEELNKEHKAKLITALYEKARTIDGVEVIGWQPIGQWLVYGHEKYFDFCSCANLCSRVEKLYKSMKRKKKVDLHLLRLLYVETFLRYRFPV